MQSREICPFDAAQDQGKVLSEEKHLELERQLEAINKPAIRSFRTEEGDILDCVDIRKQLAFDHPLLKNHTIQMRPESIPIWITNNNASQKGKSVQFLPDDIECPDGTVIIKRATKQDLINAQLLKSLGFNHPGNVGSKRKGNNVPGHHFAVVESNSMFSGGRGDINVWSPAVSDGQLSLAGMWVMRGHNEKLNSIQAGWQVNNAPGARLYNYWTVDGYDKTGCFDTLCPGFVQVNKRVALGFLIRTVSTYNGTQYYFPVNIHQDPKTGNWWFVVSNDKYVGYWPKSLFPATGLSSGATSVSWGGEVYSPVPVPSPPMGSGHFAGEGFRKAAYVDGVKVMDNMGRVVDPPDLGLEVYSDSPKCYSVMYTKGEIEPGARTVSYGGPGGCKS